MQPKGRKTFWGSVTSYVIGFLIASSWVAIGLVLALSSAKLDIGGKVKFVATDIYANITGSVEGSVTTNNPLSMHVEAGTTSVETPSEWKNLVLDFDKTTEQIVVTISIENLSDERSIGLSFTDSIASTNTNIVRKVDGTTVTTFTNQAIEPSATKTITITLSVDNKNNSASGDLNLTIRLVSFDQTNDVTSLQSKGMEFALNDDGTASVTGNNNTITELEIPSQIYDSASNKLYTVTAIDTNGFSGYSQLTKLSLPDSLIEIKDNAFKGCRKLTEIILPDSVQTIGATCFNGCNIVTKLTLSENLTSVGAWSFGSLQKLTSLYIPAKLTNIVNYAFANTSSLTQIIVDSENPTYYSDGNAIIEKSSKILIFGCKSTVIPSDVKALRTGAFYGQSEITTISLPQSLTKIGYDAFQNCSKLTSIKIHSAITSIGRGAFKNCTALSSVIFETSSGWKAGGTAITDDLSNASTAATCLTTTYVTSVWERS